MGVQGGRRVHFPYVSKILVISMILLEDRWVAKIVSKFPNHSRHEDGAIDDPSAGKGKIDLQNLETNKSTDMEEERM